MGRKALEPVTVTVTVTVTDTVTDTEEYTIMSSKQTIACGTWVRNQRTNVIRQVTAVRHNTEAIVSLPGAWGTRIWQLDDCIPTNSPKE